MATYELKKISVGSLFKIIPIVFAILGTIIGLFTFFLFPTDVARDLTIGARLLAWIIFVLLYTIIMVFGIIIISWLYNLVAGKMGGVSVDLGSKEHI
ncbi:MAG: hypothetical protein JW871_06205 [Endomicrobiales bacterium]|nr:hypothetical protein [Endomicrobiales bacterium]